MVGLIQVLVIEDDEDVRKTVQAVLQEEGYAVTTAANLQQALDLVETSAFHLIISDLFAKIPARALDTITPLIARAYPTAVGVISGWRIPTEEIEPSGIRFCISKPFELGNLLTTVAAALATPLTAEQQELVPVVNAYFAALTARDWDGFVNLCTKDVVYVLPGTGPFAQEIHGKAALRTFTEETFGQFRDAQFDQVRVYGTPSGLAARFHGVWTMPDGSAQEQSGAVVFTFAGKRIRQIGVRLNSERLAKRVGK